MSKENHGENISKYMSDKKYSTLDIIKIIISIFLILAFIFNTFKVVQLSQRVENLTSKVLSMEDVIGYPTDEFFGTIDFEKVTDNKEKNNIISVLKSDLSNIIYSNTYTNIYEPGTSDIYASIMHNEHNETIYTSNNGDNNIYTDANNVIRIGNNSVTYGQDIDIITQVRYALNIFDVDGMEIELLKCPDGKTESGTTYQEYLVDIHGFNTIKQIFTQVDLTLANDYEQLLREQFIGLGDGVDYEHPNLRYSFILIDDKLQACQSYYYFGENSKGAWNTCYSSWAFEDSIEIKDWKLDDFWYNFDYANMTDETANKIIANLDKLITDINEMMHIVAEENGLEENIIENTPRPTDNTISIENDTADNIIETENN